MPHDLRAHCPTPSKGVNCFTSLSIPRAQGLNEHRIFERRSTDLPVASLLQQIAGQGHAVGSDAVLPHY